MNNEILGIFKPKFYPLHELMIIIIILIVALGQGVITCFLSGIVWGDGYITLLVGSGVLIFMSILIGCLIYLKSSYRTMCYALYKDKLILRCGPFKSVIFYSHIKKIYEKVALDYLPIKLGLFLENYALGPIYFCGYGWVKLYATNTSKDVIVIETEKKRYGVTPEEPERFLAELKAKL